jgi:hypothetical protein
LTGARAAAAQTPLELAVETYINELPAYKATKDKNTKEGDTERVDLGIQARAAAEETRAAPRSSKRKVGSSEDDADGSSPDSTLPLACWPKTCPNPKSEALFTSQTNTFLPERLK